MTPFKHKRWRPLRKRILARDGYQCQIRGHRCTGKAEDVDHVWSWRLGRRFWFDETNLRAACSRCNRGRRSELVILNNADVPEGIQATATEIVIADISNGRTWLLNPNTRSIASTEGGDNDRRAKTDDEW